MISPIRLIGILLAAALPEKAFAQTNERAVDPFALTITGGVSLGAYEAGLNWALVSFFKRANAFASEHSLPRPRLVALAGASAGSINALLAAAIWCQQLSESEDDSTVDHNLLRDTWIPVGLDQLFPDDPSLYLREDALLSRRGLIAELENVRRKIFDRKDGYAFIPSCQIPVGLTVTRTAPRETRVGGLSTLTQRFVIPLVFEVTPAGWVRLRPQTLLPDRDSSDYMLRLAESREDSGESSVSGEQATQAILASGAFPVAFSPRQICTCEATCPDERVVHDGKCRGVDSAHPLNGLTCAGLSSWENKLKLCRWEYVDGGIFDNGPLGLAIDQVESWQSPTLLHPVRYGFVDPDVRRSQSSVSKQSITGSQRGLAGNLQLLGNLISTSRNVDLARVIKAKNWNRTTGTLVRELAVMLSRFVFVYDVLQRLAEEKAIGDEAAMLPKPVEAVGDRTQLGRLLYQCLERLQDIPGIRRNLPLLSRCAHGAQDLEAGRRAAGTPEQSRALQPLSAAEVTSLAHWLGVFVGVGGSSAEWFKAIPPVRQSAVPERARQEHFTNALRLAAIGFDYLAGELPRVARSQIPEAKIRGFRDGLLDAMGVGERLSVSTTRLANAILMEYLTRVGKSSGAFSAEALTALEASRELGRGELFEAEILAPLVQRLRTAAATSPFDGEHKLGDWLRQAEDLQKLRPLLQQLTSKISSLVQSASELQQQSGGERQLLATTRFAPLAGSQLFNFAGFLDRPLREFDYYAGVYDAVHESAVRMCADQDPFLFRLPAPEWRDAPNELDPQSLATQRCIGAAMSRIAGVLRLSESTRARQIFGALASAELAVGLGDQAAAERLLGETDWLWLREYTAIVRQDSLGVVLETLLSPREPCSKDAKQSLCIAELSFDDLITALRVRGYQPEETNMHLMLTDPDHFWKSTVQKLADRSAVIELSRTDPSSSLQETVLFGLGAAELWTRRALQKSSPPRLVVDPSSLPSAPLPYARAWTVAAAHLIPYRIKLDVSRGGVALAWLEPQLLLTPGLSIVSIVEPLDFESQGNRFSSTIGALVSVHFAGLSLGAGPRFSLHWPTSKGTDLGLEARLSFLQDRFSVGLGVRQLAGADQLRNWLVFLAVSDVNGMIYWLGWWKKKPP